MNYVKHFNINGVDTKQVACIELQGRPNAATEGAVGVLGIDMLSPTHEVYKCVAKNGSVYTWELLSAGMSIISATITGEGAAVKSFPYSNLLAPNNYLIKVGDLILDSEGYLYQITAIGADSCDTEYCGTQIGGIANGDKNCSLRVKNGKLELVTESGNVISSIDYFIPDGNTIYRNSYTGKIKIIGVRTVNDIVLQFFVGTKEEYGTLTEAQKSNLFAIITDDTTKEDLEKRIDDSVKELKDSLTEGEVPVAVAKALKPTDYWGGYPTKNTDFPSIVHVDTIGDLSSGIYALSIRDNNVESSPSGVYQQHRWTLLLEVRTIVPSGYETLVINTAQTEDGIYARYVRSKDSLSASLAIFKPSDTKWYAPYVSLEKIIDYVY